MTRRTPQEQPALITIAGTFNARSEHADALAFAHTTARSLSPKAAALRLRYHAPFSAAPLALGRLMRAR